MTPLSSPFFITTLPEHTRAAVLSHAIVCEYRAGEIICVKGASAVAIYFILAGGAQLDNGLVLKVGDSFGESQVLRGTDNLATVRAITDAQVWALRKRDLDTLLAEAQNSALALALARQIASKCERTRRPAPPNAIQPRVSSLPHATSAAPATSPLVRLKPSGMLPPILVALLGVFLVGGALAASAVSFVALRTLGRAPAATPSAISRALGVNRGAGKIARKAEPIAATPTTGAKVAPPATPTRPATTIHSVTAGDTLSDIAQMHRMPLALLRALNGLRDDMIRVDDQLAVVGGGAPRPLAPRPPRAQPTVLAEATAPISTTAAMPAAVSTPVPVLWQMPPWTSVEPANVSSGQTYWRLVKAVYFDESKAGGRVNIFVAALDENGKELTSIPVRLTWGVEVGEYVTRKTENKRDPFLQPFDLDKVAEHEMGGGSSFSPERGDRGGYSISVEGSPTDVVSGMGLPMRRHVAFLLVFQRTVK